MRFYTILGVNPYNYLVIFFIDISRLPYTYYNIIIKELLFRSWFRRRLGEIKYMTLIFLVLLLNLLGTILLLSIKLFEKDGSYFYYIYNIVFIGTFNR